MPHDNPNDELWIDKRGFVHRDFGPAYITHHNSGSISYTWYKHGLEHRTDGPSYMIVLNGKLLNSNYYINGKVYTEYEFNNYIKNMNKDQVEMLSDLGQTFD